MENYKGREKYFITAIGNGMMKLSVNEEYREEDYPCVSDKLNDSLQRIFMEQVYRI